MIHILKTGIHSAQFCYAKYPLNNFQYGGGTGCFHRNEKKFKPWLGLF